jgi:hypothetical protein
MNAMHTSISSIFVTPIPGILQQHDELGRPVLCSWTPQSPSLVNGGVGPCSQIRQRRHATVMPDRFGWEAEAFTYKGKAFWPT